MVSLAFKLYARIDPCKLEFEAGVDSWNYSVSFEEGVEWGKKKQNYCIKSYSVG